MENKINKVLKTIKHNAQHYISQPKPRKQIKLPTNNPYEDMKKSLKRSHYMPK